jgi:hypothetical protein
MDIVIFNINGINIITMSRQSSEKFDITSSVNFSASRTCNIYDFTAIKTDGYDNSNLWKSPPTPQQFLSIMKIKSREHIAILNLLEEGDFIDTEDYRGAGLWYYDGSHLHKNTGEYGYVIPSEGYKMAHKYGLNYFADRLPGFILEIPSDMEVLVNGEKQSQKDDIGLTVDNSEGGDDVITIGNVNIGYRSYEDVNFYDGLP